MHQSVGIEEIFSAPKQFFRHLSASVHTVFTRRFIDFESCDRFESAIFWQQWQAIADWRRDLAASFSSREIHCQGPFMPNEAQLNSKFAPKKKITKLLENRTFWGINRTPGFSPVKSDKIRRSRTGWQLCDTAAERPSKFKFKLSLTH